MNNMPTRAAWVLLALIAASVFAAMASGDPSGATVTNVSYSAKNVSPAGAAPDNGKGAITTLRLTSVQQDYKWKAYVGNVSSTFTLDDSEDYTIYQWAMDSFSGQVYITRSNAITWSTIDCVNSSAPASKINEDTALNHNSVSSDSINRTFSQQAHKSFYVGSQAIPANCCYSTSTYRNDAVNAINATSYFQELLLTDGTNLIYTTFVENDVMGYRSDRTFDFQAIVAEDAIQGNPNIGYYFYIELT